MNRMTFFVQLSLCLLCLGLILGCASSADTGEKEKESKKTDQFAEDRVPQNDKAVPFDPERVMKYLEELCKIGPRLSGSDGMKKQQELLKTHFEKHGAKVTLQEFKGKQPSRSEAVVMNNMIVSWDLKAKKRIMLCGHYDTRPIADQEPKRKDWEKPFVSANDGTSTVAFFMELAHHMSDLTLKVGVDLVLFDAEEYIYEPMRDHFFLGSEHFASQYKKNPPEYKYQAAILLDLFAGRNVSFPVEENSRFFAGELVQEVWAEARTQGVKSFVWEQGPEVQDDHMALNRVGIPAIDIIDFSYKHWHRLSDLPENCSGESMAGVAKVLLGWMQKVK